MLRVKSPPSADSTDRACVAGWCSREWEGDEGGREGGIHAHLWWAVISRPCISASGEGEGFKAPVRALRVGVEFRAHWCYTASQLGAGVRYNCRETSPTPSPYSALSGILKCLPSRSHCCSSGCSQGCVAQPLSRLLGWFWTAGVMWGRLGPLVWRGLVLCNHDLSIKY